MASKINKILKDWPKGTVATDDWLLEHGVTSVLKHRYIQTGWIEPVGRGASKRADEEVRWQGAVWAIQDRLSHLIHVGGKTALEMLGRSHFVPLSGGVVSLFGVKESKLPSWFIQNKWDRPIQHTKTNFLDTTQGMEQESVQDFYLTISSPERAILEVLYLVPKQQSFEEAALLMEGMETLRPKLMQTLLEKCHSVKTKRLCLFFADSYQLSWKNRLNLSKIDLGSGTRQLILDGKFDPKYKITIPKGFKHGVSS